MSQVLDYAWGRPRPSVILDRGFDGVMRYLSHDTTGKNLTSSEAATLSRAGLNIGVVWETRANRALDGYTPGHDDATEALRQARV